MAKKLLVKEPRTLDGKSPMIDETGKVIYKESLVEDNRFVREQLEAMNIGRQDYLKVAFSPVETEFAKGQGGTTERVKKAAKPSTDEKAK